MPARAEEIHHVEEEGVVFNLLTNPVAFHSCDNSGWVREVECIRMELGEPDASGRRRPISVKDSNFRIPADVVVISIGQSPNPLIAKTTPDLKTGKDNIIIVDPETGKTSKRGVFAGGDVSTGGATVILAMGAGKKAAVAIDHYLRTGIF
jgi:glutamate synthase (NADPH/NADH) small chain